MESTPGWPSAIATLAIVTTVVLAAPLRADEVTAKGTAVRGKVTRLSSSGVMLEPEYGEGEILMRWKDVQDVTTDEALYVQYGEDREVVGAVRGKSGNVIRAGDTDVDVATIYAGNPVGPEGPSWKQRLRGKWRYWHGNLDLGFDYQRSTIKTSGLAVGFDATRSNAPTRLILGASYRYFSENRRGETSTTLEDQIKGLIRGEIDLTERVYGFASEDVKYDTVERLRLRSVPKIGVGYTIFREDLDDDRPSFVSVETAGGWVYQQFVGGLDDDYFAVSFGVVAAYTLPYDSRLDWRFDYLPAVDDWTDRYLLRHSASLAVPIFDPISAKLTLFDDFNSKPARDTAHNSLYLTAGLSLGW